MYFFFFGWLIAFSVVAFYVLAVVNDWYYGYIPIESDFLNCPIYGFALLVWRSAAVELKLCYQMRMTRWREGGRKCGSVGGWKEHGALAVTPGVSS